MGFIVSACLAHNNRWRHISVVASLLWLVHLKNVIFFHFTIFQWVEGGLIIGAIMLLGGALSYLFKG